MTKPIPFRSLQTGGETVSLLIDGKRTDAPVGVSVSALLLREGRGSRVHVKGGDRAPYCMMGVCFECLVTINGERNRQGCLVTVAEGMEIEVQDHV
ncbi:MAG: (2Fe-2S)-binding protein [Rhizobiales bacterium]|nr:(2Fe-2S)-binding protein [Hyphomicrobiales bacterium]MBA68414.1 (2Fe-2S)-binding protein [Hyphomicrobiales bacterium]|tara:strand:+ start:195 stop:482 length:288 start_codon:yes stop_codon:yes gene_type:complete